MHIHCGEQPSNVHRSRKGASFPFKARHNAALCCKGRKSSHLIADQHKPDAGTVLEYLTLISLFASERSLRDGLGWIRQSPFCVTRLTGAPKPASTSMKAPCLGLWRSSQYADLDYCKHRTRHSDHCMPGTLYDVARRLQQRRCVLSLQTRPLSIVLFWRISHRCLLSHFIKTKNSEWIAVQ